MRATETATSTTRSSLSTNMIQKSSFYSCLWWWSMFCISTTAPLSCWSFTAVSTSTRRITKSSSSSSSIVGSSSSSSRNVLLYSSSLQGGSGSGGSKSSGESSPSSPVEVSAAAAGSAANIGAGPQQQQQAPPPPPQKSVVEEKVQYEFFEGVDPSDQWELDCYSRPVLVEGGKKLWDVLITDSSGSFRASAILASNKVNSRELRRVVEEVMEESDTKPSTIRFFRGAMFNMINIALTELDVEGRPSRCTFALAQWLEDRNKNLYPKMEGYKATMANTGMAGGMPSFLSVRTPVKLPDALRGEKYAFVSLPLAEFRPGGGVTKDNIGVGRLCPCDDPDLAQDSFVQGIVILTKRAKALAQWLAGTEVVGFCCDLRKRILIMEANIETQYLMARLDDVQRTEGAAFEEGKEQMNGLHFVSVQQDENDDPSGFWLLRDIPENL